MNKALLLAIGVVLLWSCKSSDRLITEVPGLHHPKMPPVQWTGKHREWK